MIVKDGDHIICCTVPYEPIAHKSPYYKPKYLRVRVRGRDIRRARLQAGIAKQKDLAWLCEKEDDVEWGWDPQQISKHERPGVKTMKAHRVFTMCRVIARAFEVKRNRCG